MADATGRGTAGKQGAETIRHLSAISPPELQVAAGRLSARIVSVLLAFAYPFLLQAYSGLTVRGRDALSLALGWGCLLLAFAVVPAGLVGAYRFRAATDHVSRRWRLLNYLTIGVPPLFVFIGVTLGLVGKPLDDESIWILVWLAAIAAAVLIHPRNGALLRPLRGGGLRVLHGVAAAAIAIFIAFHLTNHLAGLFGPDVHAAVMAAGRKVYRFAPVEFVLVGLLALQVVTGLTLALRGSVGPGNGFRVLQIGTGIYVASFIVTHLNSALISARSIRRIETNWAWASGQPEGLLHDAWNIRLVPHYSYGVLCILVHLLLGLRQVLVAHDVDGRVVTGIWRSGLIASVLTATAIMAGLLGARL